MKKLISILLFSFGCFKALKAETVYSSLFDTKQNYTISKITVEGNKYLDSSFIIESSGLKEFQEINIARGDLTKAIKNIIEHDIVNLIEVHIGEKKYQNVSLVFRVVEFPRLENIEIEGVEKNLQEKIIDTLAVMPHSVLSRNYISKLKAKIKELLEKKDLVVVKIDHEIIQNETLSTLKIIIQENAPKQVGKVVINGLKHNDALEIKSKIKHNHEKPKFAVVSELFKKIFSKKFFTLVKTPINLNAVIEFLKNNVVFTFSYLNEETLEEDKKEMLDFLKSKGYIDAEILDTKIHRSQKSPYVNLIFEITEREQYKIGNVIISGNVTFTSEFLKRIINLEKGDIYNKSLINERISSMMAENSIAALYYSFGYMQYRASLVEKSVENNKVNFRIEIRENDIYKIGKVSVQKNTITTDNIILRETSVLPGEDFDGNKLARSLRDLAMLQIFDPAALNPSISMDQKNKRVNIAYNIKESPKIGGNLNAKLDDNVGVAYGFELSTNNAALGNIFRKMMPLGSNQSFTISSLFNKDGQKHSVAFTDPMISEKYPYSISLGAAFSKNVVYDVLDKENEEDFLKSLENDDAVSDYMKNRKRLGKKYMVAFNVGWGKKLSFIDYSSARVSVSYKYVNYLGKYSIFDKDKFKKGEITNLSLDIQLSRDTRDGQIFPKSGYSIALLATFTPPYSLFSEKFTLKKKDDIEKIKFMEYHQTMVDFSFYTKVVGNLIGNIKLHTGFLGSYGGIIGPFERFAMGGTESYKSRGITSLEHIILRGYDDDDLTPRDKSTKYVGGVVFEKAVFELKYPIIESAIIHLSVHSFIEAGNCWAQYKKFNILDVKGSFGFGFRAYIGLVLNTTIGLDFGCPINQLKNKNQSFQTQFSLGVGR